MNESTNERDGVATNHPQTEAAMSQWYEELRGNYPALPASAEAEVSFTVKVTDPGVEVTMLVPWATRKDDGMSDDGAPSITADNNTGGQR